MRSWAAAREEAPGRGFFAVWVVFCSLLVFCMPIWFGSVFGARSLRDASIHP